MLILLARLARFYRVLPHVLLDLPADELSLAVLAYMEFMAVSQDSAKKISRDGGMVVPIVDLGG